MRQMPMPARNLLLSLLLGLLLPGMQALAQGGWTEAKPVAPPARPAPETAPEDDAETAPDETPPDEADAAAGTDDTAGEAMPVPDSGDQDGDAQENAAGLIRRLRPLTTAAELEWIEEQLETDPYFSSLRPIGPAPETPVFYDPFTRLRLEPGWLRPSANSYLVQGPGGEVLGSLLLRISREQHPAHGPVLRVTQSADIGGSSEQLDVLVSATTGRPLRVQRSRDLGGASAEAQGVLVRNIERLDAKYLFDRVTVTKTAGGVTLAVPTRLQYACFDVAQLPLLMHLLDYSTTDWPFEALLFDSTSLETPTLQVNRPRMQDVLSAEPERRQCWEIPVRWGHQRQTWYIERHSPRRLVKFSFSGLTFTLQDYAELK